MYSRTIQTIDSHTEGNPTRVTFGASAIPRLESLVEQRDWVRDHDDQLRRLLNFEPRGNAMMCAVLLLPPTRADADFGAVIMEQDEYVPMCGHCIIGAATTIVASGMVPSAEGSAVVRFDTPAGLVSCSVDVSRGRPGNVTLSNVPSFVLYRDAEIVVPGIGSVGLDVAYGGDMYAIVDADSLDIEIRPDNDAALIDVARAIIPVVNRELPIAHPQRPTIDRCYETLFTTTHTTAGDVKHAVVSPPGALDRSPCGTGSSARLALMFDRGEIGVGQIVRMEGLLGTTFGAVIESSDTIDGRAVIQPRITGRAYITGYSTLVLDQEDPFPLGYRVGPRPRDGSSAARSRSKGEGDTDG